MARRTARGVAVRFGRLEPDVDKRLKYIDFVDIYADLDDNERQRYQSDFPIAVLVPSTMPDCVDRAVGQRSASFPCRPVRRHRVGPSHLVLAQRAPLGC